MIFSKLCTPTAGQSPRETTSYSLNYRTMLFDFKMFGMIEMKSPQIDDYLNWRDPLNVRPTIRDLSDFHLMFSPQKCIEFE